MPTLLDLAGVSCQQDLDGVSFSKVVQFRQPLPRRPLYWASLSNGGQRSEAIRQDEWKLVVLHPKATRGTFENPQVELYNLSNDPGETTNVAEQHPKLAESMLVQLRDWYAETQKTATEQPGGWIAKP